jgi:preprotein translocase subunit SecD
MNRYPLWTYVIIAITLVLGALYTVPNFFGESPAVQVAPTKITTKVDTELLRQVEGAITKAGVKHTGISMDTGSIKIRFDSVDAQIKARDVLNTELNKDPDRPAFSIALNLLSSSPRFLTSIRALPMYLGLDLRGGVHLLLQVDMRGALTKRLESNKADLRAKLRSKEIRHAGMERSGDEIVIRFNDVAMRDQARNIIERDYPDVAAVPAQREGKEVLIATLKPTSLREIQEHAIKQNIVTLNNRVNALGVAEPVIQQQGADRIVVQVPGVQDPNKVKEIVGRTATLEVRLVDETADLAAAAAGNVPLGTEVYFDREQNPVVVKKDVVLTGDRLSHAQATVDTRDQQPAVSLRSDPQGARILRQVTRENINKRMAILLFEQGRGEVLTAPVIREEFGENFQISGGAMTPVEASDLALLLRAGSLAAPMHIVEERTVGPSLGEENIKRGFNSTQGGFIAIAIFMIVYYTAFGAISVVALGCNLLFLVALLSVIQATLTLPGMAAIALTIGMAIDANVLINERIREELRNGLSPPQAIFQGYERAFGTILDSNVTTLIAGVSLLIFGSGPVRGFAVVLCLGILTSMFSGVVVSRAIVNLTYGRQRRLASIPIGQVWRPDAAQPTSGAA